MKTIIVKIFILYNVLNFSSAVNYCNLCKNHVACGNNGKFSSKCPKDATLLNLSNANIQTVLKEHNDARNLIASGRLSGYKSATRMMTLKWDSELASLAALNVKQCEMKHDGCRATQKYPKAGQNLYYGASTGSFKELNTALRSAVKSWFDEYKLASQSQINQCCGGNKLSDIGHFLQLVQDRAVAVGCAASKYTNGKWKTTLIACNYSFGNMLNDRVYETGSAASSCPNGKNSVFTSLCN